MFIDDQNGLIVGSIVSADLPVLTGLLADGTIRVTTTGYLTITEDVTSTLSDVELEAIDSSVTTVEPVLVGGSPNPSVYERQVRATPNDRVVFTGYVYGDDVHSLMKHAYAYVQSSDVEGLSPV